MNDRLIPLSVSFTYPARRRISGFYQDLLRHRRTLITLVADDLRRRSAGGALSWVWGLLHPAMLITTYAIVFSHIIPQRGGHITNGKVYIIFLCLGMFSWLATSKSLLRGTASISSGRQLLKRAPLPLILFPVKAVLADWVLACATIGLLLVIAPWFGVGPHWSWLLAPIPVFAMAITVLGLVCLLSVIGSLIKDTSKVLQLLMPILMWTGPIVYAPEILPEWARTIQAFHPLALPLHVLRDLVISGSIPGPEMWLLLLPWPLITIACGLHATARWEGEVRDAL